MNRKQNKPERRARRNKQKEQGYFDGRFAPRVQDTKKQYKRKPKHGKDKDNRTT